MLTIVCYGDLWVNKVSVSFLQQLDLLKKIEPQVQLYRFGVRQFAIALRRYVCAIVSECAIPPVPLICFGRFCAKNGKQRPAQILPCQTGVSHAQTASTSGLLYQKPLLKTSLVGPNSLFNLLKARVRCDLKQVLRIGFRRLGCGGGGERADWHFRMALQT